MIKFFKLIVFIIISAIVMFTTLELENTERTEATINIPNKLHEKDYVNKYCTGIKEYTLPDKTRIDCLTDEYAIEFDFAKKWAESIGQSLYYAKKTGKKPAVAIITSGEKDKKYLKRIQETDEHITIFEIPADEYYEKNSLTSENIISFK